LWWNGRGEDATAKPPQKKHNDKAAAGRGMAPSSHGRVYLNGTRQKIAQRILARAWSSFVGSPHRGFSF
jgi:hypothetical protein